MGVIKEPCVQNIWKNGTWLGAKDTFLKSTLHKMSKHILLNWQCKGQHTMYKGRFDFAGSPPFWPKKSFFEVAVISSIVEISPPHHVVSQLWTDTRQTLFGSTQKKGWNCKRPPAPSTTPPWVMIIYEQPHIIVVQQVFCIAFQSTSVLLSSMCVCCVDCSRVQRKTKQFQCIRVVDAFISVNVRCYDIYLQLHNVTILYNCNWEQCSFLCTLGKQGSTLRLMFYIALGNLQSWADPRSCSTSAYVIIFQLSR